MATDERKPMLAAPNCKSKKVDKKIKTYSFNTKDLLIGKRYSFSQKRAVKAALQDICSTRKTGHISESRKIKILAEFEKYSPEIVERACDYYVAKECAADGKNERYLIAIMRNSAKQQEIKKKQAAARIEVNTAYQWMDGNRIWAREEMERQQHEVSAETDFTRLDPAKVSRVNRCMHDRPGWDWR